MVERCDTRFAIFLSFYPFDPLGFYPSVVWCFSHLPFPSFFNGVQNGRIFSLSPPPPSTLLILVVIFLGMDVFRGKPKKGEFFATVWKADGATPPSRSLVYAKKDPSISTWFEMGEGLRILYQALLFLVFRSCLLVEFLDEGIDVCRHTRMLIFFS